MQLSVKDLSKLLNVCEKTIYRWIKQEKIPVYRIHDQYRFNRLEILDWATAKKIKISHDILKDACDDNIVIPSLTEALKGGGIIYRVEGSDKKTLLASTVNLLSLPEDVDKESLLSAMIFREELGSTGVGDGIAIPHARYPTVTHIQDIIVFICFSENPVDFGAMDGKPVSCLFILISPTVRSHLKMLSRIAFVLRDESVRKAIVAQESRDVILKEVERAEKTLQAG